MYIFLFLSVFFLGPCILAGHFVFYMGCIDIEYCIYDICDLWTVFVVCVYGSVFGYVFGYVWMYFLAMCLDMYGCVSGYVYGFVWMYFWLCVWICMDIGS